VGNLLLPLILILLVADMAAASLDMTENPVTTAIGSWRSRIDFDIDITLTKMQNCFT
jgi:hypothetical protein